MVTRALAIEAVEIPNLEAMGIDYEAFHTKTDWNGNVLQTAIVIGDDDTAERLRLADCDVTDAQPGYYSDDTEAGVWVREDGTISYEEES